MKPNPIAGFMIVERVKKPMSMIDRVERFEDKQGLLIREWEGYKPGSKVIFEKAGPAFEADGKQYLSVKASDIIAVGV